MRKYYRPIVQTDSARPANALALAGGLCWFDRVEVLQRGVPSYLASVDQVSNETLANLTSPRPTIPSLDLSKTKVMGILNVTPDSFSDGGKYSSTELALEQALQMIDEGVEILDIGGESTRPGADEVPVSVEKQRVVPVIETIRKQSDIIISVDTRKSSVARAAIGAGASMINDVSAMTFDPEILGAVEDAQVPICLMHSKGQPKVMQVDPRYENVLLDVFDYLESRIKIAVEGGIDRSQIIVDPGIGFGKTQAHNLALLRGVALFHGLGCPILLGASRKKFIGTISNEPIAENRVGGSLSVALKAVAQGVQILRVHDTRETTQALKVAHEIEVKR